MKISDSSSEASRPFLTWQRIADWAHTHYRDRTFAKDERIPARQGLIYLVNRGVIRLTGKTQVSLTDDELLENLNTTQNQINRSVHSQSEYSNRGKRSSASHTELRQGTDDDLDEAFLGFVSAGQPFEIVVEDFCHIEAYAHVEETEVIWLYWQDLENWPHFSTNVYEVFRYQHQRKLLWLSALGQRKTIERLMAFLTLLVNEYGKPCEDGYCLPYTLTHAQIGSTIGSTRVTVTRLMGKLRRQGSIVVRDDNLICLPLKESRVED